MTNFELWFGGYFSDGIEAIGRLFVIIGNILTFIIGGFAFIIFAIICFPLSLLGFIVNKLGFKSRWN